MGALDRVRRFLAAGSPAIGSCVLCGERPVRQFALCAGCISDLPVARGICLYCGRRDGTSREPRQSCDSCSNVPRAIDRVLAPYLFDSPLDTLIWKMKFGPDLLIASVLGDILALHLKERVSKHTHTIIPVPLHRTRLKHRGFNQAAELVNRLAGNLGMRSLMDGLQRVRSTAAQTTMDTQHARRANLDSAFVSTMKANSTPRILLVDDVMTSGATLFAAAHCLRQIDGVCQIDAAIIARAPRQRAWRP